MNAATGSQPRFAWVLAAAVCVLGAIAWWTLDDEVPPSTSPSIPPSSGAPAPTAPADQVVRAAPPERLPGTGPGYITEGYMAYYPPLGQTMYFGGSGPPVSGTVNNETWLYDGPTTAIAAPFGQGCPTSMGVPDLTATTLPQLGMSYVLTATSGTLSGVGVITHGFSNTMSQLGLLPFDMASLGLAGCRLEVSPEASRLIVFNAGSATNTVAFPNSPGFANVQLYSQVGVLDALAPNSFGGVTNAVHAVLGQ